jgi:hypothetical protein
LGLNARIGPPKKSKQPQTSGRHFHIRNHQPNGPRGVGLLFCLKVVGYRPFFSYAASNSSRSIL